MKAKGNQKIALEEVKHNVVEQVTTLQIWMQRISYIGNEDLIGIEIGSLKEKSIQDEIDGEMDFKCSRTEREDDCEETTEWPKCPWCFKFATVPIIFLGSEINMKCSTCKSEFGECSDCFRFVCLCD